MRRTAFTRFGTALVLGAALSLAPLSLSPARAHHAIPSGPEHAIAHEATRPASALRSAAPPAPSGQWVLSGTSWYWLMQSGDYAREAWYEINARTYSFAADGTMRTGWHHLSGEWYHFADSGALSRGWVNDRGTWYYLDPSSGAMRTGLLSESGSTYYLEANGAMALSWRLISGTWYYFDPDRGGAAATSRMSIAGATYSFNTEGRMITGWSLSSEGWRYYNGNGSEVRGWLNLGVWYYLDPSSGIMRTGELNLPSGTYFLSASGAMITGWNPEEGTWRYYDSTGRRSFGWVLTDSIWYYLDPSSGLMQRGWVAVHGTWYWFDDSGAMAIGSRSINGGIHHFAASGAWIPTGQAETFTPGLIISDANMFDSSSMNVESIQAFLQARNPYCRNADDGTPCLSRYRVTTQTMDTPYCAPYVGASNETAASVIDKSARACGINPKVLLVMLQKEQALVTASGASLKSYDPDLSRYDKALGYACPDSARCSPTYRGFAKQLYHAASQLVKYGERPEAFRYRAGATSPIAYHPNAACGSSQVYLENRATAALYNYTPYQPNAAALANMRGIGDSCSTYGNRNFWRIYKDWFGDPRR